MKRSEVIKLSKNALEKVAQRKAGVIPPTKRQMERLQQLKDKKNDTDRTKNKS